MANIGILGSGNVGANTAFFLAEKAVGDVLVADVQEGLSTGKALDMMEAAPVRGYKTQISGTDSTDEVLGCNIVIVTAGNVRQPGMKREELLGQNREIVTDIAQRARGSSSKFIVVTEPVDLLTSVFAQESGLPREQVLGLGGILDATRLRYLISAELGIAMENIAATVVGRHADDMIPLREYSTVSGIPITRLLSKTRIDSLFEQTRSAGDLIVEMAQRANAYYGPSAAACDVAEAIHWNLRRVMPVSMMLQGEFGVEGVAMSLPAIVGEQGIERVLEPKLTEAERSAFTESAKALQGILA
jgi:malate dehydrogenase